MGKCWTGTYPPLPTHMVTETDTVAVTLCFKKTQGDV
jgi:hypothetical protein